MRKSILILLLAFCIHVNAENNGPILWNMDKLQSIVTDKSQSAFISSVISSADRYSRTQPLTVVNKTKCISGNPHNFESLSIYFWPDPANPNGPYIVRDGYFNPEYKDYDLPKLIEFTNRIKTLALAYFFSNNPKYAARCLEELRVWFINENTYMTPTFEYAQVAPGHWNGKGAAVGLVDAYYFVDIIESLRLLQQRGMVSDADNLSFKTWFNSFLDWSVNSDNGRTISAMPDNVSTAYDVLIYSIASYVDKKAIQKEVIKRFNTNHITDKIDSKGRQIEELKRPTAMTYSIINLNHLLDFYIMLKNTGKKISKKNLKIISKAANYLEGFVDNKDKFEYKELNDWNTLEKRLVLQTSKMKRLDSKIQLGSQSKAKQVPFDVTNVTE